MYEITFRPRLTKEADQVRTVFPEPELLPAEYVDLENSAFFVFWSEQGPLRIYAADTILSVKLVDPAPTTPFGPN